MSNEPEIRHSQYAEKEGEVVLREHEYDGIQEYEQKLPNWWLFIFIAAHIFFLGYWVAYYNFGWFKSDQQKISAAMTVIKDAQGKALDEMLAKLTDEALFISENKEEFAK
jgi:cytochrome c oxidase cbb3-type subunit 3